jgi:hypothetical protein
MAQLPPEMSVGPCDQRRRADGRRHTGLAQRLGKVTGKTGAGALDETTAPV